MFVNDFLPVISFWLKKKSVMLFKGNNSVTMFKSNKSLVAMKY